MSLQALLLALGPLAITRCALEHGDIVVATARNPNAAPLKELAERYSTTRLLLVKLDVTEHQDILDAFPQSHETYGRLDVVVNNAAYAIAAEVEGMPDDLAHAMFETNFWGGAHVLQEAVRVFREVNEPGKGARIIHISSASGVAGYPVCGFYCASKHAMESLTETLAMELDPEWNIKPPPHQAYDKPGLSSTMAREALLASLTGGSTGTIYDVKGDINKASRALYRLSELPSPPLRLVLGKGSRELVRTKVARLMREAEDVIPNVLFIPCLAHHWHIVGLWFRVGSVRLRTQLILIKLDVIKHDEIKQAFQKAKDVSTSSSITPAMPLPAKQRGSPTTLPIRCSRLTSGAVHVSQEAVRFFREENKPHGGHLIQNSAAGFSKTLYKEVDPAWNVKSLDPGFDTEIMSTLQLAPQHPAHANSNPALDTIRKIQQEPRDTARMRQLSDTSKGVQKIFELTRLAHPPLRIPLGKDSVGFIRGYAAELTQTVEEHASWSDDLAYEGDR
ncbi:NAD(P)-binding protein [Lentinus tigrinus ALCF2SS1-7]|uniref:NAD(P)-binding protein n=1 Tax=Lentinus tigrinus ALCF2SS1-7 TaxID=1328758 RepID=UPI0011663E84|nr:NAD(P)-binding protein [Lentinus tigrinus ALCF2SS1-7]